jgi:hypothetical protein
MAPFVKIVGGALGAVNVAGDVVRHVAWYVSHHTRCTPR